MTIEERYQELCNTPSDINEHLPKLKEYADKCHHVTELGVRGCVSLYAFLASAAKKVVAVDICDVWVPESDKLKFLCANDIEIELEETDFLFIDTLHNYVHCIQELQLHAPKVRKYIGFHDTYIFGEHGDDGGKGLNYAIAEFLQEGTFREVYRTKRNNGLTILERV